MLAEDTEVLCWNNVIYFSWHKQHEYCYSLDKCLDKCLSKADLLNAGSWPTAVGGSGTYERWNLVASLCCTISKAKKSWIQPLCLLSDLLPPGKPESTGKLKKVGSSINTTYRWNFSHLWLRHFCQDFIGSNSHVRHTIKVEIFLSIVDMHQQRLIEQLLWDRSSERKEYWIQDVGGWKAMLAIDFIFSFPQSDWTELRL
jgi:hypothetical protein